MAIATNFADLEKMIHQQLQKAMQDVQTKVLADMQKETIDFYSQGFPHWYERTGNLRNSPRVTPITGGGDKLEFDAYLDTGYYLVPNPAFTSRGFSSKFKPIEVFTAAEAHKAHILGKGGFWARSLVSIEKDVNKIFSSYFK